MYGIVKGDARYQKLAEMLPSKLSSDLSDFIHIDQLVLPLAGIDEYYNIKQSNLNLLDILRENDIKTIIVGNANNRLKELCSDRKIHLIELLKNQTYVKENAFLTAMGIISYISSGNRSISDYRFIILGYGNIGFYLAKLLKAYQAEVQVFSCNDLERKYIDLEGIQLADFKNFDIVINTIPANLDWDYQKFVGKRIIDVASAPYGFDVTKINELGIRYEIVSAIPAKFASESAAKIIKKIIENEVIF